MARIELENLSFTYPGADTPTLRDLNLHIADGEAHALLGASGSGKTTLLNLLSGLLEPSAGGLMFDGADVAHLPGRDRGVAQVFQFPVLYEGLAVRDNLAFALRNRGYDSGAVRRRVEFIAEEVQIEGLLNQRINRLSLFEKQLVAVAKALVREDVAVVLLDEPLTAVEPKTKWRLRQTLRRVQADTGVTMVYVTHDQTEALTFADRVSVLADGEILQTGTPHEIYATPRHTYVGHFVGSPGMNYLPATAFGGSGEDIIGFRPEWADVSTAQATAGSLGGTVSRVRMLGTENGSPVGVSMVNTAFGAVHVRGPVAASAGERVELSIERHLVFRDDWLIDEVTAP